MLQSQLRSEWKKKVIPSLMSSFFTALYFDFRIMPVNFFIPISKFKKIKKANIFNFKTKIIDFFVIMNQ